MTVEVLRQTAPAPAAPRGPAGAAHPDTQPPSTESPRPPRRRRGPRENSSVVRKTTAGLTANLVQLLAALVTGVVLARTLGPDLLGQYYLLYTITLTLSLFVSLGVEAANSVFVGRGEEHPGRIHTASLLLTGLLGGTAVAAAWAACPVEALGLVGRVERLDFLLALLAVPFILYQNLVWSIFIGTGHLVLMSRTKIAIAALRLLGDLAMVSLALGVRGLIASFLVCSALGAGLLLYASLPVARPRKLDPRRLLGRLTGFGVRSHLGTIAGQLHFRADTFILNAFHGTGSVGLYSVAVQAAELPLLFFGAIGNAIFARVSGSDRAEATRLVSFLIRLGFGAWLVLVTLGLVVVPPLMLLVLGPAYATSGQAFALLIGGTAAIGVSRLCAPYFLGQLKRPGLLSGLAWLNVGVNVALCFLLIPRLSVLGAAAASLGSYTLGLGVLLVVYARLSGLRLAETLRPRKEDLTLLREALRSLR